MKRSVQKPFSTFPKFAAIAGVFLVAGTVWSSEICRARIDCPINWNGDTVRVADNVVALSSSFYHCAPDSIVEGLEIGESDTISLFFIIDQSGSMRYMDSTNVRYSIVRKLIDTIARLSPASEIGLAVFSNQLMHSYKDDPFFVPLDTTQGWHDSYVPFHKLSTTVGGVSAAEKLKWAVELSSTPNDTDIQGNVRLLRGNYSSTGRVWSLSSAVTGYAGGTDITLGFQAALKAFQSASNRPDRQIIVFLSDGEAQSVDKQRVDVIDSYIAGIGVPTTYSAFFINRNMTQPIPPKLLSMTDSIKNNNYSTRNQSSEIWKTLGSEQELFSRIKLELSIGGGLRRYTSTPLALSINGINSTKFDDTLAYLAKQIALTGKYTTLNIGYTWKWNELNRNATNSYSVVVMQSAIPEITTTDCWDQGTIEFFYQGRKITSILDDYRSIEVRFTPPAGTVLQGATIVVKNLDGSDSLVLAAANQGQYFGATFLREYGVSKIDNILQNAAIDSLVAVYRNPALPLDTLRNAAEIAAPRDVAVRAAYFLDENGNGYPDVIRVIQGEDKISLGEDTLLIPYITLQTQRSFSIKTVQASARGFDILLNEPDPAKAAPFTGLYPDERLFIQSVSFPGGGGLPAVNIALGDSMAPVIVKARYLDVADVAIRDTFEVFFSEKIRSIDDEQPFLFQTSRQTTEYSIRFSQVRVDSSTALFSVVPLVGQTTPQAGDSVKINPLSGISDSLRNVQDNAANARKEVSYLLLHRIEIASYTDNNADGLIDAIVVKMDMAPDAMMLDSLALKLSLPPYRQFSWSRSTMVATDSGFIIKVTQPAATVPFTGVDSRDILTVSYTETANGNVLRPAVVPIGDLVAPVVNSASFIPSRSPEGTERLDTLKVKFSESIPVPTDSRPFTFYDPETKQVYTMVVRPLSSGTAEEHIFVVTSVQGKTYPEQGDLVSISPAANVGDLSGNVQLSQNDPAPLTIKAQRYSYQVTALPNPLDPTQAAPPEVVSYFRNNFGTTQDRGLFIAIEPKSKTAGHVKLSGKLTIYDAVGNVVMKELSGAAGSNGNLAFVWDGTNDRGRVVGNGAYLAIITIEDNQGFKSVERHKLGIKRKFEVK